MGQADRPFPEQVNYPSPKVPLDPWAKSLHLVSRVMSLVPMRLKNDMWNADVDFDLAAFHSLVRILKRALRHLTEASLASVLLKDLPRVKLLPPGFMCSSPCSNDPLSSPAMLPSFMLPRACMGIVCKFFMRYTGDPSQFSRELVQRFPCCMQAKEDLRGAFLFWNDLRRCVDEIVEPLGVEDLAHDFNVASEYLQQQQKRLGIFPQARRG